MSRVETLLHIEKDLLFKLYGFGVLAHLPGEVLAGLTLSYGHPLSIFFFQLLMTLSDGIGVLLVFLGITFILNSTDWSRSVLTPKIILLTALLGFITATITEYFGVYIFHWWAYPAQLCTLSGIACGALYGWMVLPLAPFWISQRPLTTKTFLLFLNFALLLGTLGTFFIH